uniref:Uncharacterized protein n=1 Tax=Colletotrichum fructicola (strain Nara gc5) TaxID=1213859 RepID=L2FT91_COLFN
MRFTSILVAGVFAVAAITKCLAACPATDVNCQAKCIAVPSPNADQINKTTECVAACDQGDGSAAATEKFAKCRDGCISEYYFTSGGTPNPTGSSGGNSASAATATGSETAAATGSATRASGSASGTATGTGSAASGTSTGNAAPALVGSAAFGVIGMVAAALL